MAGLGALQNEGGRGKGYLSVWLTNVTIQEALDLAVPGADQEKGSQSQRPESIFRGIEF